MSASLTMALFWMPRSIRYCIRSRAVATDHPSRAIDWTARRLRVHPSLTTPEPTAELMVDGFQGSGNSYFFEHFLAAQSSPRVLIGHVHSPVKIRAAIERGIPTVILIRDPAAAVVSAVSRWPSIPVPVALKSWHRFYAYLLHDRGGAVVATFEEVISDTDGVVRSVNRRFGTCFELPVPVVSRPVSTAQRDKRKREVRAQLGSPVNLRLIERCNELYHEFDA